MTAVRARSRPRRPLGDGWVLPAPSGPATPIGNLDSGVLASVDPAGLVTVAGRPWSLDWWVGAEDRWHLPAREVAVRQTLLGGSPVVETRLRVPSGDAVHRAYAARGEGGQDVVVVEVHNDSKVPFAVALALRPFVPAGEGRLDEVALDGTIVSVDGEPVLGLPRSPGRVAVSTLDDGDAARIVLDGEAEPVASQAVTCRDGRATAALLFPLAHAASLRVVLVGPRAPLVSVDAAPSAATVSSGWAAQSRSGARFEVPERRLRDALAASTRFLLLGADGPEDAVALDLLGFHAAAGRLLDAGRLVGSHPPGRSLAALARHWSVAPDPDFAARAVPAVAALVTALARSGADDRAEGLAALPEVARLLAAAGELVGAEDARSLAQPAPAGGGDPVAEVARLLAAASPTWCWEPAAGSSAALVTALRRVLVDDTGPGLALAPAVPEAWLGQGWEVHDAPTAHGRLSYAIRWHGDRPALLWELDRLADGPPPPITVPGLDPGWATTEPRGDALLAAVPVPARAPRRRGLSIPVAIEPRPRGAR